MITADSLARSARAEIERRLEAATTSLLGGTVSDYAQYREQVGYIRGLRVSLDALREGPRPSKVEEEST